MNKKIRKIVCICCLVSIVLAFILMFDTYDVQFVDPPSVYENMRVYCVKKDHSFTISMVRFSTILWREVPDVFSSGEPVHVILETGDCKWMHIGACSNPKPMTRISDILQKSKDQSLKVPIGLVVQWAWEYVLKNISRKNTKEQETVIRFLKTCQDRTMPMGIFGQEFRDMFCKSIQDKQIQL